MTSKPHGFSPEPCHEPLNAIGKARQLALLLLDLYGMENFQPISAFEHEQDFYAQVADGNEFPIPRGKGELLASMMGLPATQQLRQLRALLRIPREIWIIADDENWTQNAITRYIKFYTVDFSTVSAPDKLRRVNMFDRLFAELTSQELETMTSSERRHVRQVLGKLARRLDDLGYDD